MKYGLSLLVATAGMAVAEIIPFNLENGLQPLPPPPGGLASAGSGGEIETGIWFDTETRTLRLVLGYGSAAGFTDMTGAATQAHIHGPKSDNATPPVINTNAVLYELSPVHFPNSDPLKGGIIRGEVVLDVAQTNDLFLGLDYVNIHTEAFPGGELRGFLKPVLNQAPVLTCPANITEECKGREGNLVRLTITVADPEGDAMAVIWMVDGKAVKTREVPAGAAGAVVELTFERRFLLGEHEVKVLAKDAKNTAECSWKVIIQDTTPPLIRRLTADPRVLWPPNHKMVKVKVKPEILDCTPVKWRIVKVTSNEPVNDTGDGNTSPDWVITGDQGLSLRAERSGKGTGRIYTVTIEATDAGGLTSQGSVEVSVPHSMGRR